MRANVIEESMPSVVEVNLTPRSVNVLTVFTTCDVSRHPYRR
jgi:hypothetical protein